MYIHLYIESCKLNRLSKLYKLYKFNKLNVLLNINHNGVYYIKSFRAFLKKHRQF